MPGKIPNEEGLTEDEIARRKLGPRGVPGGGDFGENDTTTEKELAEGRRIRRPRCLVFEIGGSAQSLPQCVSSSRFSKFSSLGTRELRRAAACQEF